MSDSPQDPPNITYENDTPGDERPFSETYSPALTTWD
jgi:hypothetical protein